MTPILFLHGFTSSAISWNDLINKINHPSIAIDLPGHGNNLFEDFSKPYTFENWQVKLYTYLIKNNLDKVILCGYSMGGRLAVSFACAYPKKVESIILISSTAGITDNEEQKNRIQNDSNLFKKINTDYYNFVIEWENLDFFSKQKKRNPNAFKQQREIRKNQNPTHLAFALENLGIGKMPNYWDKITKFNFPVLIICGNEDSKYCTISQKMNGKIPNSQLKIIQNSGHAPQIDQPHEVSKIIEQFIKS